MRWLPILVCVACSARPGGGGDDDQVDAPAGASGVFDPKITNVVVEIDYETGQEPYTGTTIGLGGDAFDLTYANIGRIFAGKKQLAIPRTTAQMQDIGAVADEEITGADALALASMFRDQHDSANTITYYVLFLSGHFADANGPQNGVLGVSFGRTNVIVMFKDVIKSSGLSATSVPRAVEQSTLIHELSHAIGLVDNGVAMVGPHKDAPHGAHCNNDRCVMYWLNEGASDAAEFVKKYVLTPNAILFDAACLADVDALTGGP